MYKPIVSLVLLPLGLAGCAANQNLPIANFAADGAFAVQENIAASQSAAASAESGPVEAVDLSVSYLEMGQPTVCEQIRRPGSRIVIGQRCYAPDAEPEDTELRQEMVRQQVEFIRREREQVERMQREHEEAMRRAAIQQMMRDSMRSR